MSLNQTSSSFITPPLPLETTKALLESKRPDICEIELTLFENCNIVCHFCFHDKKSPVGLTREEMFSKLPIIEQFLKKQSGRVQLAQINLVGGELLQDRWMERLCTDYFDLLIKAKKSFDQYSLPMKVVIVSNFLFKKKEIVKELIDKLRASGIDSHLIVSYDFEGRPTSGAYLENISYFGPEYICSVNLVGTKGSIKKFIQNDDVYFKHLYKHFNIYFDDFIPDAGADTSIPSDREFFEWYSFIAKNYPKIQPVAELIENKTNKMHCLSLNKITIFPDNRTSNCRWHRYKQSDFGTKLNMHDNAGMMQSFIDQNGCLSCEYFKRCGFRCFTQWDWKNRQRDMDICPMKAFFNELGDSHQSV
jgi:sulfatase maturation enzyme AslB (radical SAM superfamily)